MTIPADRRIQTYWKTSSDEDLAGLWVDALGWIACYFAQLEGLSYEIIDLLASAPDKKRAPKLRFQERTDLAKKLICARLISNGSSDLAKEWAALLRDVKSAGPLRNKVLHNPLGSNLLSGPVLSPDEGIVLVTLPGKPVIKLGAVQEFAKDMVALNQRMLALRARTSL